MDIDDHTYNGLNIFGLSFNKKMIEQEKLTQNTAKAKILVQIQELNWRIANEHETVKVSDLFLIPGSLILDKFDNKYQVQGVALSGNILVQRLSRFSLKTEKPEVWSKDSEVKLPNEGKG